MKHLLRAAVALALVVIVCYFASGCGLLGGAPAQAANKINHSALMCQIGVAHTWLPTACDDVDLLIALVRGEDPMPHFERLGVAPAQYKTALEQFRLCGPVMRP